MSFHRGLSTRHRVIVVVILENVFIAIEPIILLTDVGSYVINLLGLLELFICLVVLDYLLHMTLILLVLRRRIVDNESCVNVVSSKMIEKVGLEVVPHPHPYKVSWINSTALNVKQQCLDPIEFNVYKAKI